MGRDLAKLLDLNGPGGSFTGPGAAEFDAFSKAYDGLDHFLTMEFNADGDLLEEWHKVRHFLFIADCEIRDRYCKQAIKRQN